MTDIYYFAYGSNMLTRRLQNRVSILGIEGAGSIEGYKLTFHKRSTVDGSGKCDVEITGNAEDIVEGVVYKLSSSEKAKLDSFEALGQGYSEKTVDVRLSGRTINAVAYYATATDTTLEPYGWYKDYVVAGAREHGLSNKYIKSLEAVSSKPDPDTKREAKERAILNPNP